MSHHHLCPVAQVAQHHAALVPCVCIQLETAERDARAGERLDQCAGGDAWQIGFQDGYESAILSAVQRVEALLQIDHTGTPWLPDDVPAVIAAIKGDQ